MPGISTSSATTTFSLSGVSTINPLLNENHKVWSANSISGTALTYSFPWINGASASWQSNYSTTSEPQATTHSGLNATQISAAINALQTWANVANVSFTQVADTATNVGDFRFAFSSAVAGQWGWCYYPGSSAAAADVWINPSYATSADWSAGSYNFDALIHEIGHGLGLKHPGNYNGSGGGTPPYLPANLDYRTYTIMSYNDLNPWFLDTAHNKYIEVVPETPMVYDIAAIQYLFGANYNYHTENDTYTFSPSHPFYMAIWDAGGIDTISVSNFSTNCTIDLTPGHYSSILYINQGTTTNLYTGTNNLGIAFGCIIENVKGGSGNDTIIGNNAINTLLFTGKKSNYTVAHSGTVFEIHDTSGTDGTDSVTNVEVLQFSDKTNIISPTNSTIEYIALLYQGALGRTPDAGGLRGWVQLADNPSITTLGLYGLSDISGNYNSNLSIAAGFTHSTEFIAEYGSLSDTQFVTQLYANILDRAPDSAGLNGWLSFIKDGMTREHALVGFAESNEAIQNASVGFVGSTGIVHDPWLFIT